MEKLNSPPPVVETDPVDTTPDLGFSDDLLKDIGLNNEIDREEVLSQLETMYGGQVFKYGPYQGTVRDIADLCPAFNSVLKQGDVAAIAAWLEANNETSEEEEPKEELIDDESQDKEEVDEKDENLKQTDEKKEEQQVPEPKQEKSEKEELKTLQKLEETSELEAVESTEIENEDVATLNPVQESENRTEAPVEIIKQDVQDISESELVSEKATITEDQSPKESILEDVVSSPENISEIIVDEPIAIENEIEITPEPENIVSEAEETDINIENEAKLPTNELESIEGSIAELAQPIEGDEPEGVLPHESIEEIIPEIPKEYFEETEFQYEKPAIFENSEINFDLEETLIKEDPPTLIDMALELEQESELEPKLELDPNSETGELVNIINEDQENIFDSTELVPEITEIISELTQEVPKIELDDKAESHFEFEPLQIYQQAYSVVKKIELLEKARTAEECKEALKDLRIELADLLQKFGYTEYDYLVERLIQSYDVATLKKYMAAMMQKIIKSRKAKVRRNRQTKILPARKYGSTAVRRVINLINP